MCQFFLDRLNEIGIQQASLLVVPNWYNRSPIWENRDFMTWLRELADQDHEICLHGHSHLVEQVQGGLLAQFMGRIYTDREGDYHQISYEEAKQYIAADLEMFTTGQIPIHGFTPPAWLLSQGGRQALIEEGLLYSTSFTHIDLLQRGRCLAAPTITYSSRRGWRRWVSKRWTRFWHYIHRDAEILRIAVHPLDLEFPTITDSLFRLLQEAKHNRVPTCYRDVVKMVYTSNNG